MSYIDKLEYTGGRIKSTFKTFNCEDETDMEILCTEINSILVEHEIKIQKMETQLTLIKQALDL